MIPIALFQLKTCLALLKPKIPSNSMMPLALMWCFEELHANFSSIFPVRKLLNLETVHQMEPTNVAAMTTYKSRSQQTVGIDLTSLLHHLRTKTNLNQNKVRTIAGVPLLNTTLAELATQLIRLITILSGLTRLLNNSLHHFPRRNFPQTIGRTSSAAYDGQCLTLTDTSNSNKQGMLGVHGVLANKLVLQPRGEPRHSLPVLQPKLRRQNQRLAEMTNKTQLEQKMKMGKPWILMMITLQKRQL
jgi:hypothetical protein